MLKILRHQGEDGRALEEIIEIFHIVRIVPKMILIKATT